MERNRPMVVAELKAQLAAMTAERDAAVRDLREVCELYEECDYCIHATEESISACYLCGFDDENNWQRRGIQEESV